MFPRRFMHSFCVAVVFAPAFAIYATASIQVGDLINFQNGPGSPGGEFGVTLSGGSGETEAIVFCVEKDEFIDFTSDFYVSSISKHAVGGGVDGGGPQGDPVDARSAWLYYNFRKGTLPNYVFGAINDYSAGRAVSANAMQNAIWFIEQEQGSAGVGQAYVDLATQELGDYNSQGSDYSGNMNEALNAVRILNIRWDDEFGDEAQSQMFLVPEPGSALTWSVLAIGGAFFVRRRKSAKL